MTNAPKLLVAKGYNRIADAYLKNYAASSVREKWLGRLISCLPAEGGRVLDLGCGAGVPVSRHLASLGHSVLGVDVSAQQILRARRNVPEARFVEADMCEVEFSAGSFDAVAAFYSITHVPREQQAPLIARIADWIKPGGALVASFGAGAPGDWTGEWLGAAMFFSHDGEEATRKSLSDAGLTVRRSSIDLQDNEDAEFLWIEAVKQNP